jgi:hypothetical protein
VLRYVLTRIGFLAVVVALVVCVEYVASEVTGFHRTQRSFMLSAVALAVAVPRLLRRSGHSLGWVARLWRRHMEWATVYPWWAVATDAGMIFVLAMAFVVDDGFVYALWNAAASAAFIAAVSATATTAERRIRRRAGGS